MTRSCAVIPLLLVSAAVSVAIGPAWAQQAERSAKSLPPDYRGGVDRAGPVVDGRSTDGDGSFRGEGRSPSSRDTSVAAGAFGLARGRSMAPYAGSFVERFDDSGRAR